MEERVEDRRRESKNRKDVSEAKAEDRSQFNIMIATIAGGYFSSEHQKKDHAKGGG